MRHFRHTADLCHLRDGGYHRWGHALFRHCAVHHFGTRCGRAFAGCRDCADYLFHRTYSGSGRLGKLLSGGGAWRALRDTECAVLHCDGAYRGCISQDIQKSLCACVLRRLHRHCGNLSCRVQGLQRRRHEYHHTGIAGGCEGGGIPAQDSFYRADLRRRL